MFGGGLMLKPHLKLSTIREYDLLFGPGHDKEVCRERVCHREPLL